MGRQNKKRIGFGGSAGSSPEPKDKPKAKKKSWGDNTYVVNAGDFFGTRAEDAKSKMGGNGSLLGTEAERAIIGLPLRAFSTQYLYSSSAYPLGRMEMTIGESDSCKTAFLFEKGRWYLRETGGGFIYLLNEARDPAELRTSIIGRDLLDPTKGGFRLEGPCASLEDWQRRTTGWLHQLENTFETGGCGFPFMLGLDSITGTTNERTIDNIDKEGCAQITFGQDANLLNQYFKYLFQRVYRWPLSFVCTNHIKYGTDRYNNRVMKIPGGDELRYASTYITHLKTQKQLDRLDISGGRRILISSMKSMGDKREVGVDFVWQYGEGGEQKSLWDWHSASAELLSSFSGERKKLLDDIIDFPVVNRQSRTISCPALGFRKAVPYDELGKALMDSGKLLETLQDHFGIKRRRLFQPGVIYSEQIAAAIQAGEVEAPVRTDVENAVTDDEDIGDEAAEIVIDPKEESQ